MGATIQTLHHLVSETIIVQQPVYKHEKGNSKIGFCANKIENKQGRTGSPNRPGKFSWTGPHYRAKTPIYHVILVVQQSLWAIEQ